jgi:hypothetical protein
MFGLVGEGKHVVDNRRCEGKAASCGGICLAVTYPYYVKRIALSQGSFNSLAKLDVRVIEL